MIKRKNLEPKLPELKLRDQLNNIAGKYLY